MPDLPGCFSAGDTLDEAIANAKDAITGHIELLIEMGQDIPAVSSVGTLAKAPEYAGYTWAVVDIDVTRNLRTAQDSLPKRR